MAVRPVQLVDVHDGRSVLVLDPPVVRDAGLRVLLQLHRAVPVCGLGGDHLCHESYFVRSEPGAVSIEVRRRHLRSSRRKIFPEAARGTVSMNSTPRTFLYGATRSATQSIRPSTVSSAPGARTT